MEVCETDSGFLALRDAAQVYCVLSQTPSGRLFSAKPRAVKAFTSQQLPCLPILASKRFNVDSRRPKPRRTWYCERGR